MKRIRWGLLLLLAGTGAWIYGSPKTSAAEHEHVIKVGKTGEMQFDSEIRVGELTLKPGRYKFQHRVEGSDHFVHFTEVTKRNPLSGHSGGEPKAHPGEVKCTLEPLNRKVSQTIVVSSTEGGNHVIRVEVAGENVAHIFQ